MNTTQNTEIDPTNRTYFESYDDISNKALFTTTKKQFTDFVGGNSRFSNAEDLNVSVTTASGQFEVEDVPQSQQPRADNLSKCELYIPPETQPSNEQLELDHEVTHEFSKLVHSFEIREMGEPMFTSTPNSQRSSVHNNLHTSPSSESSRSFWPNKTQSLEELVVVPTETIEDGKECELLGRRIVDIRHLFDVLRAEKHGSGLNCCFMDMIIISEKLDSFHSTWTLKCKMCNKVSKIESINPETSNTYMPVNPAMVHGFIAGGGGYAQLVELTTAADMPCMAPKTFIKHQQDLAGVIHEACLQVLIEAGKEEKAFAEAHKNLGTDGTPMCIVVADRQWCKRSYKTKYDSLSGVVHRLMLNDKPRVEAYRNAIFSHKNYFKDKIVMDVGAGTGILSLFCAQAGAKKVYAIEASSIANLLPIIAKENKFENVIQVIHSCVEDVVLADEKVDVIVSEWMGFYLLHEGMLDSVIFARDHFLKTDGKMFPHEANIWAASTSLPMFFDYWEDIYGVKMKAVGERERQLNGSQPKIVDVNSCDLLTQPVRVCHLDLNTVTTSDLNNMSQRVVTHAVRSGSYQGLCITFDCHFPLPDMDNGSPSVVFSTGVDAPHTHWKQTAIVFEKEFEVEEGAPIAWELNLKRNKDNPRHYDLQFEMLDPEEEEHPKPCGCYMTKCIVIKAFLQQLGNDSSKSDESDANSENENE